MCVLDSFVCARLHALALELVHTPGGGRSASAAVRGSVCFSVGVCVRLFCVCCQHTHTHLVVGVCGSVCLCRCVLGTFVCAANTHAHTHIHTHTNTRSGPPREPP